MSENTQAEGTRSVPRLVRDLVNEVAELIRTEMRLARSETTASVRRAGGGLIRLVGGALVAFAALVVLLQALVIALTNLMPPTLAALLVGGVVAVVGLALTRSGQDQLRPENLAPQRTARTLAGTTPFEEHD